MIVHNEDPMSVIYGFVKDLGIRIFKNFMDADENSIPESYILLKAKPTDNPRVYGDGETLMRVADSEITLISKGAATTSGNVHNLNCAKIESSLKQNGINYTLIDLGYDKDLKNTQTTYEVRIHYCG